MICCLKSNKSSAKVVEGKLILSFPHANTPVVWQMDFIHVKASALEVQNDKDEGPYTLTLKTPKGETTEIAAFDKKEDAVKGLIAASKAMENAQGKIPVTTDTGNSVTAAPQKKKGGWAAPLLGILMLIILLMLWGVLSPQTPNSIGIGNTSSQTSSSGGAVGVPMSADSFLQQSQ